MKNVREVTMRSPDQYRHFALTCRLIAQEEALDGSKEEMLEMAETWEKLADAECFSAAGPLSVPRRKE